MIPPLFQLPFLCSLFFLKTAAAPAPAVVPGCSHLDIISDLPAKGFTISVDFVKPFVYGSPGMDLASFSIAGKKIPVTYNARGQALDLGDLHFSYDLDGWHPITLTEAQKTTTLTFEAGARLHMQEIKQGNGGWRRYLYTYNNSGDPEEIQMVAENHSSNGTKRSTEEASFNLRFNTAPPSLALDNPLFSSFVPGMSVMGFLRSRHLISHMVITHSNTQFNSEGHSDGSMTALSDYTYTHSLDEQGRLASTQELMSSQGKKGPIA